MKISDLKEVVEISRQFDAIKERRDQLTAGEEVYLAFSDKEDLEVIYLEDDPDLYASIVKFFDDKVAWYVQRLANLGVEMDTDKPGGQQPSEAPKVGRVG